MPLTLINILLPFALEMLKEYIKSSSSKQDDKVLELTKQTCEYLAKQDNNTLTFGVSAVVNDTKMKGLK